LNPPAGSRIIEAYSLKLGRRLQCFGEAVFEQWIRLEVDPTIQTFCERPLDLNFVDGVLRVDFWVRQGDREMLLVMDDPCESEIPVPQLSRRHASNRRQQQFDSGADIHSVSYDGRLSIRLLRNRNRDDGIEVTFSQVDGFRFLDEVLLAEYWSAEDFPSGYPVLEVFEGGWAKEENARLGYTEQRREWIVVTAGACFSVFSKHEPEIRDAIWPANV